MLKAGKHDNAQRKRDRMFRGMGICMCLKFEIDHGLMGESSLGRISASEVLNSLESELEWPKNIEYF